MTYRPPHVRADDRAPLLALIATHPLATFITVPNGEPVITYVPMLAREADGVLYLEGHIARANNQWQGGDGTSVALFRVADHYISPTWYATKAQTGRVVPTFDYVSIEARGAAHFIEDTTWLREFVARLTVSQEARVGAGWTIDEAPADYMESQLKAIVGVQMRVDALTGLFKLNRHHPAENVAGVIKGLEMLENPDANAIAAYMRVDLAHRDE
ncbi:MAG TPA: FMN-binding negative transcriptional regulator [Candidatus Acidoferrum sp.]|jgi:transcriptional regulator|nr:FMN-binding negative transcriptional regulator [Candidatus Acidoferrum sp.]